MRVWQLTKRRKVRISFFKEIEITPPPEEAKSKEEPEPEPPPVELRNPFTPIKNLDEVLAKVNAKTNLKRYKLFNY